MLASLRDQRLSLLLTDQPRLISIPTRPSHLASVQQLLHCVSSPRIAIAIQIEAHALTQRI
jgi:hypothetical protein